MDTGEGVGWPLLALDRRPTLVTQRLTLEPPVATRDMAEFVAAANDPEVVRWLARVPHPYTPRDAAYFFAIVAQAEFVFLMRRRDTGVLVGSMGLKPRGDDTAELGYWLARAQWRLGFATEAARALVDHAFTGLRLAQLTAAVAVENQASLRVLQKVGFVEVGRSTRSVLSLGGDAPHIELALAATTQSGGPSPRPAD